jgi:hypothetical protein
MIIGNKERVYAIKIGGIACTLTGTYQSGKFGPDYIPSIESRKKVKLDSIRVDSRWTIFTMDRVIKYLEEHKNNSYRHLDVQIIPIGWAFD